MATCGGNQIHSMQAAEMKIETLEQDLTAYIKTTILSILVLLNMEASQLGYLLIMVFLDSIFGLLRAVKLQEGASWKTFIWGIVLKISILIIPFLLAGFGLVFKMNLFWLVRGFIYLIAVNDLISILASIISMKTGKRYKSVDFIERGIHAMMNIFSGAANKMIQNFNPQKDENPKDSDQPKS